jgi:hypothetical protein
MSEGEEVQNRKKVEELKFVLQHHVTCLRIYLFMLYSAVLSGKTSAR